MASKRIESVPAQTHVQPSDDAPTTFDRVLDHELDRINDSRGKRDVTVHAHTDNLTGLAFSGGGIRSATFNLGILQALAQKGLLCKFDYLSTVSGGGYIGSWLAALTRRLTAPMAVPLFSEVEKALCPSKATPDRRSETSVVHWLRLYSNYLTPNTGVVSGDTWAMLGTWLRNVILNQTILGMVFVSVFVLCQSALLPLIKETEESNDIDLFIDDGSHVPADQILTAKVFLPLLAKDGIYVIEDVYFPDQLSSVKKGLDELGLHYQIIKTDNKLLPDDRLFVMGGK